MSEAYSVAMVEMVEQQQEAKRGAGSVASSGGTADPTGSCTMSNLIIKTNRATKHCMRAQRGRNGRFWPGQSVALVAVPGACKSMPSGIAGLLEGPRSWRCRYRGRLTATMA